MMVELKLLALLLSAILHGLYSSFAKLIPYFAIPILIIEYKFQKAPFLIVQTSMNESTNSS
jgi:hypothetical protein